MTPAASKTMAGLDLAARSRATAVPCYGDNRLAIVRGEGCRLWDADGRKYLDLLSGLGAACLGQGHAAMIEAIGKQMRTLGHCSNLFTIAPQVELAEWLCDHTFAERVFFSNSGAEAIEAAIKLARHRAHDHNEPGRREIVTLERSFHGRTYAAMSATGQSKVHVGFDPLVPGMSYVAVGDEIALEHAITERTAAVLVEPIQGEAGVREIPLPFLARIRELTKERKALLICDEVQCGMGRTGGWLACDQMAVRPDIVAIGKGLGGGMPIGAILTTAALARHLGPGSHGTTYGGNPVVCATALAVMRTIEREHLVPRAAKLGDWFRTRLTTALDSCPRFTGVRGRGLMIGIGVTEGAAEIAKALLHEDGIIVNAIGDDTIRLLPPLVVSEAELAEGADALIERIGADAG